MDPLLKWVGSKRWHVAAIKALYRCAVCGETQDAKMHDPGHCGARPHPFLGRRIVEPFCGGAAISFGLEPRRALLNDANPHLANFYRWMRDGVDWDFELNSSEALYYDYRAWFNRLSREGRAQTADAAQLFYYLIHHGFNGLCRFNKSGEFNVPFRAGRSCPVPDWTRVQTLLAGWEFTCDDFSDVLLEPSDFVYADPPYDGTFSDYTEGGWSRDQMESLAVLLRTHPGPVVLMNAATDWVMDLFQSLGYVLSSEHSGQAMHRSRGRTDTIPEVMAVNFRVDPRGNIEVI